MSMRPTYDNCRLAFALKSGIVYSVRPNNGSKLTKQNRDTMVLGYICVSFPFSNRVIHFGSVALVCF